MAEEITVIVVALIGGKAFDECLAAVRAQSANILAVRRDGTITDADGRTLGVADRLDIPAKRRSAVELATTPLVALIEDTVVPARGRADAISAAFRDQNVVACGGPVRVAHGLPAQTRALILSEYARYNDRHPPSEVDSLPGCNFAFRRDALLEAMRGSGGLVDNDVFRHLKENGGRIVWKPEAAVTYSHAYPEGARLKTRFEHGRITGSSNGGALRRTATAAKALLLPPVLTARTLREAGIPPPGTLGWLLLQHTAWSAGELVGAVMGSSRKGLDGWR